MITKRIWLITRKRKSLEGFSSHKDKWIVGREGWFLFGVLPLYIRDVTIERKGLV